MGGDSAAHWNDEDDRLFLCLGAPDENTQFSSNFMLCQSCITNHSYIRGERGDGVSLRCDPGGTISWRFDGREGTLDACVDGGEMRRVFDGAIADEVYCGVFLDDVGEVKLESFHRMDAGPVPSPSPEHRATEVSAMRDWGLCCRCAMCRLLSSTACARAARERKRASAALYRRMARS